MHINAYTKVVEETMTPLDELIKMVDRVDEFDGQFPNKLSLYYEISKYLHSRLRHVELLINQTIQEGERV